MRLTKLMMALACLAISTQATTIFSDGFNADSVPGSYQTIDNGSSLGPWTVGGDSVDWIGGYWQSAEGNGSIDMSGNNAGSLSTTLDTVAGQAYVLSFYLAGNPDGGNSTKTLNVQVGDLNQDFYFSTVGQSRTWMGWLPETVNFVATDNAALTFTSLDANPWGAALDGVVVSSATAVPEPASCALILTGLAGVIALIRRRR
jgi:choice-of-anchor C domain-containing protein